MAECNFVYFIKYVDNIDLSQSNRSSLWCKRCRTKRSVVAPEGTRFPATDMRPSSVVGPSQSAASAVDLIIEVLCALCVSPPHSVACDVTGDVTVQRCMRGVVDELELRQRQGSNQHIGDWIN